MKNKNHVITRKTNRAECGAVYQNDRLSAGHIWQTRSHVYSEVKCQAEARSDVVIPNKLGNGETCQGLRHWRLLSNLKNNFSKPVRNDMNNKTVTNLLPYFPISLSSKNYTIDIICSFTTLRLTLRVAVRGRGSFLTTIFTGRLYGAN